MANYVMVFETKDLVEAQLYAGLLSEAGLQVVEQRQEPIFSPPWLFPSCDCICLGVPENEAVAAAELVSTYRAGAEEGQYALPVEEMTSEDASVMHQVRHFDTALQLALLLLLLLAFYAIFDRDFQQNVFSLPPLLPIQHSFGFI